MIYRGRTAITCFHPDCNQSFKTFALLHLQEHREHRIKKANKVRDNCAHQCVLCQKQCSSSKQLLHHLHQHLKKREVVCCPFARCFYSCVVECTLILHYVCMYNICYCSGVPCASAMCLCIGKHHLMIWLNGIGCDVTCYGHVYWTCELFYKREYL